MTKVQAPAIVVENLSKVYRVYASPLDSLKEMLLRRPCHTEFRALDQISFEVGTGERVGIVGRNGAGKSTLLKVLAGTTDHTSGRFQVGGRVRAILELGTGFQDDRTGRENVLIGGMCMGYEVRELEERMEWIVGFSELARVIDQPLRTYSTGMRARLMFAVAFCLGSEMMIVDEALSTGDGAFVRKCTNHLRDLCRGGATVFMVSHNLYLVERFCDRLLYLREGRLEGDGPPDVVIRQYEHDLGEDFVRGFSGPQAKMKQESVFRETRALGETEEGGGGQPAGSSFGREPNGKGVAYDKDGTAREIDFTGAPPVRKLGLVKLLHAELLGVSGHPISHMHTGASVRLRLVLESHLEKKNVHLGVVFTTDQDVLVASTTNAVSLGLEGAPNGIPLDLVPGILETEVLFPSLRLGVGHYFIALGISPGFEHFSEDDLLLLVPRSLGFSVARMGAWMQVTYEPVAEWSPLRQVTSWTPTRGGESAALPLPVAP